MRARRKPRFRAVKRAPAAAQRARRARRAQACGAGRRAAAAAALLEGAGVGAQRLRLFRGGWAEWKAAGLPEEAGGGA